MSLAILALLLAGFSPPGGRSEKSAVDPCGLLTRAEVARVAGAPVVETKTTRRAAGEIEVSDCFYRTERFDRSVSVEIARSAKAAKQSIRERWTASFEAEKEREEDGGHAEEANGKEKAPPPRRVEGVGDEAFWLGNPASGVLYVLKGDAYLRVSVGGAGDDAVKQRQATELARRALARM